MKIFDNEFSDIKKIIEQYEPLITTTSPEIFDHFKRIMENVKKEDMEKMVSNLTTTNKITAGTNVGVHEYDGKSDPTPDISIGKIPLVRWKTKVDLPSQTMSITYNDKGFYLVIDHTTNVPRFFIIYTSVPYNAKLID